MVRLVCAFIFELVMFVTLICSAVQKRTFDRPVQTLTTVPYQYQVCKIPFQHYTCIHDFNTLMQNMSKVFLVSRE